MQRAEELAEAREPEMGGCLASAVRGRGSGGRGERHQAGERRETWGPESTKYDESWKNSEALPHPEASNVECGYFMTEKFQKP